MNYSAVPAFRDLLEHLSHKEWWVRAHAVAVSAALLSNSSKVPVQFRQEAYPRRGEVVRALIGCLSDVDTSVARAAGSVLKEVYGEGEDRTAAEWLRWLESNPTK